MAVAMWHTKQIQCKKFDLFSIWWHIKGLVRYATTSLNDVSIFAVGQITKKKTFSKKM